MSKALELEIKTSMLFNLDFANNTIFSCSFFFFLIIAELVIPIGIPTKEAKTEMETHPVVVEAKIRKYSI